jgi:hypothetical protein
VAGVDVDVDAVVVLVEVEVDVELVDVESVPVLDVVSARTLNGPAKPALAK